MKVLRRCYGCGRYIWSWQDAIDTKEVGRIHNTRDCILDSCYKLLAANAKPMQLVAEALIPLNKIDNRALKKRD